MIGHTGKSLDVLYCWLWDLTWYTQKHWIFILEIILDCFPPETINRYEESISCFYRFTHDPYLVKNNPLCAFQNIHVTETSDHLRIPWGWYPPVFFRSKIWLVILHPHMWSMEVVCWILHASMWLEPWKYISLSGDT